MNLPNKNILLTGATGGIGRELTTLLAQDWANLILVSRHTKVLRPLLATLPGRHLPLDSDLSTRSGRNRVIRAVRRKKLPLHVLINCAGIGVYKTAELLSETDWYQSYELNVHTPFLLSRELAPELTVNIGSCSALQYQAGRSLYNSTKAALRSLTLCLAKEKPLQFTHITLDSTLTEFGPLSIAEKKTLQEKGKTYLSPRWVAEQIVQIIRDDSRDTENVLSPECI